MCNSDDENINDTSTLNTTRVTFSITVPAYVSDALQVRLVWGDKNIIASWVVYELWTISDDLPINTTELLTATFSDGNGDITLGSIEQEYRTGSNTAEIFQITEFQFDTDRWDNDNDGVSNLSESIVGTNPQGDDTLAPLSQSAQANLEIVPDKTFRITWQPVPGAQFYRVLESPMGYPVLAKSVLISTRRFKHLITV